MENEESRKWYSIGSNVGAAAMVILFLPLFGFMYLLDFLPRPANALSFIFAIMVYLTIVRFKKDKLEQWLKKREIKRVNKT